MTKFELVYGTSFWGGGDLEKISWNSVTKKCGVIYYLYF